MRSIRKLALLGLAALMVCAAVAASASALTAYDQSSGAALAVGSSVNGVNSGNAVLTGLFNTTVTCTGSQVGGTVQTNNSTTVGGPISSLSFSNCTNSSGTACSVTVNGLPWSPSAGGLLATSTTSASVGMGASGSVTVSGCFFGSTCTFTGAGTGPGSLTHSVTGAWTNSTAKLAFTNASLNSACGSGTWTTTYVLRTGSTPGSGNLVGLK